MKKAVAILATVAFLASTNVANAWFWGWGHSSDVTISVTNGADVDNTVTTKANTGYNTTDAGSARVRVSGDGDNGGNDATGGDSDVNTGDAAALSDVLNNVNGTDIRVSRDCDCEGKRGDLSISVDNEADVDNEVTTKANTGKNYTDAGSARVKVSGDDNDGHWWKWWHFGDDDDDENGDNDADGGNSDVDTGDAEAGSIVTNYVNQTVIRASR